MSAVGCERKVLIVEDDRDIRGALREILHDEGFRPLEAVNGQDAIDRLGSMGENPCVILLDIMMPVMDGWGFRTVQQADPQLSTIPVVVLTAHANAEQTAREMLAAGFLKKPVSIDVLLKTVNRYCS
jgi:CheY-like chemotaxis protein